MGTFVNEYKYTPEVIAESTAAWYRKHFKKSYILLVVMIPLALLLMLQESQMEAAALIVTIPLFAILLKRREKRAIRIYQERSAMFNKNIVPAFRIEISNDIHITEPNSERHLSLSDLVDVFETKNLIILEIRTNLFYVLDKNGFIEGSSDECIRYLKGYCATRS